MNQACCLPSMLVQNTSAFLDGQHERDYAIVTWEDRDHAIANLMTTLIQSEHAALTTQLRANEAQVAPLSTGTVTADLQAGAEAATVTITVAELCTASPTMRQTISSI